MVHECPEFAPRVPCLLLALFLVLPCIPVTQSLSTIKYFDLVSSASHKRSWCSPNTYAWCIYSPQKRNATIQNNKHTIEQKTVNRRKKKKIILLKIQIGFLLLHLHPLLRWLCLLIPLSCYNILEKTRKEMRQERAGAYYFCSKYVKISIKWHSIINSLILIIPVHLRCISFGGSVGSVAEHIWSFHFLGRVARACSRPGCWRNKRVPIGMMYEWPILLLMNALGTTQEMRCDEMWPSEYETVLNKYNNITATQTNRYNRDTTLNPV